MKEKTSFFVLIFLHKKQRAFDGEYLSREFLT